MPEPADLSNVVSVVSDLVMPPPSRPKLEDSAKAHHFDMQFGRADGTWPVAGGDAPMGEPRRYWPKRFPWPVDGGMMPQ
jgi:hypothetical protein